MTLGETKKLLGYITAAYPSQFKGDTESTALNRIAVWQNALQEYSYESAMVAANAYIATDTKGFPPVPGQITAYIHAAVPDASPSAQEAWALVRKAVNVPWEKIQESFDRLPQAVRKAVGSAASLKELAKMDIDAFENVAGSNFQRTYRALAKREEERERMPAIPPAIQERIAKELEMRRQARNPNPAPALPDSKEPEPKPAQQVSEDRIDDGMAQLRRRLGAAS